MASQKLQEVLSQLKSKLSEKERSRMEGMTLKELMNDTEFKDLLKNQIEVLEGIETTLSDLSKLDKLDKLDKVISAVEGLKFPDPISEVSVKNLKDIRYPHTVIPNQFRVSNPGDFDFSSFELKKLNKAISEIKLELPTKATDPISVRLSDGKEFYKMAAQMGEAIKVLGGGSSGEVFENSRRATVRPQTVLVGGKEYVAVVNPDGTSIGTGGGGGGDATAAKQDEQTALLTTISNNQLADGHNVTVDNASLAVTGTFWQATQPVSGTVTAGLSAGTNVVGIVRLQDSGGDEIIIETYPSADNLSAQKTLLTTSYPLVFDGSTWDRMRGDSTDGVLVNLGGNNDVGLNAGTNAIGKLLPPDVDVTTHTNYAKKYYTNAGAVTDGIIWSPAAGKRWHVVSLFIQVSAAATVTLEDDLAAGDSAVLKMELAANSGIIIPFTEKYPLASGEDAADLLVTTSAGNVYVTAVGYEI